MTTSSAPSLSASSFLLVEDDNPTIIEQTRQYIRDFDRLVETTTNAQELYDKMLELYPNRVNPGWALWSSVRAVKQ
jgi:hypothetical protein